MLEARDRKWVLLGLGVVLVVLNLDLTMVNLALPEIGARFGASLAELQWVNNVYSITFAALVAVAGKLADRHGHRSVFLGGLAFCFVGSLIGAVATDIPAVLVGRMLQGVGLAGSFGTAFTLVAKTFPKERQGFAVSLLVVFAGVAQAAGPTAGGVLVEWAGFRSAFWINLPFCLAGIVLIARFAPSDAANRETRIHAPSAALLSVAFFVLMIAFNGAQERGFADARFLLPLSMGVTVLVSVLAWQRRLEHPLFDLGLFRNRTFLLVNLVRPLFQAAFGAFAFVLPLYIQNATSASPARAGLVMLALTAALAGVSPIAGKINDRIGPEAAITAANVLAVLGYTTIALAGPGAGMPRLIFGLVCIGLNVGLMYSGGNLAAMSSLPLRSKGIGFGMFTAGAYLFYSVGIAVSGYVLATSALGAFHTAAAGIVAEPSTVVAHFGRVLSGAERLDVMTRIAPAHAAELILAGRGAFARGFSQTLWLFSALSAVAFVCGLPLLRRSSPEIRLVTGAVGSSR